MNGTDASDVAAQNKSPDLRGGTRRLSEARADGDDISTRDLAALISFPMQLAACRAPIHEVVADDYRVRSQTAFGDGQSRRHNGPALIRGGD
ncbi:hypothetical protein F2P81_005410 [Scophthalmus maximus]|uniref:Uncharacterized protein n=1 Tax=Scophthalmus maximus TaxID=52904 RepID=A0A6A4TBW0_SCOMX|nr:hypothetical protein F2P81_005410 [Scophthalmus maximus]